MKRCEHCHRHGGRVRSSRLCADCKARGWRWCSMGKHVIREQDYDAYRYACRDCRREETRMQKRRARGLGTPPIGYVRLVDAMAHFGYSRSRLRDLCQLGQVDSWQYQPGGAWYIRMEATE